MSTENFKAARDLLLALRDNYEFARSGFQWPKLKRFNWALDWFDAELAKGEPGRKPALKVLGETVETLSFAELSEASNRVANGLRALGAKRGDRLLLMLGNTPPLWIATLAAMKLGLIVIPATTLLTGADIADRISRGRARFVVAEASVADRFAGLDGVKHRGARLGAGLARFRRAYGGLARIHARRSDQRRRSAAALFHLRHDGAPEAGAAQPRELSRRPPVDDVRARAQARRRASQHLLARLGQTRLVQRVRALERRRLHPGDGQALRRARHARRSRRP